MRSIPPFKKIPLLKIGLFSCLFSLGHSVSAAPIITEFMASNESSITDEEGVFSDWIEVHNPDATEINLGGYYLSDDRDDLTGWQFPSVTIAPDGYLLIFASGKDRKVIPAALHTDFKLSSAPGYIALVMPSGTEVVSSFGDRYPVQFEDVSYGRGLDSESPAELRDGYFTNPTPGEPNQAVTGAGPGFLSVTSAVPQPSVGEPFTVMAEVEDVNAAVASVTLFYRVDFGPEVEVSMTGNAASGFMGDIPGGMAGQLIRWRFRAEDSLGFESRNPSFQDPEESHQYYGTVVVDPAVDSLMPVVNWFIEPQHYADLLAEIEPVQGGVFYLGEYYDNVSFTIHGQSSRAFAKKSFNLDFNKTQRFLWKEDEARVKDINLLTNWGDKSKVRHVLAYEVMREAGVPTHFAFSVRVQQNGEFFSIADFIEDGDEIYLERAGLDPEGSLYKVNDSRLEPGDIGGDDGVRKKTRKKEGNADLHDLINGLALSEEERWDYIYDHVDIPTTINSLAAMIINMQTDMHSKNYYLYHDTERSGEWSILPWDMDLTFGRNFRTNEGGYFNIELFWDGYTEHEESSDVVALVELLIDGNPETRAMFFRRLRTLADLYLQEESTPLAERYLEGRLDELTELMDPLTIIPSDAQQDFEKWGSWRQDNGTPVPYFLNREGIESMREAIERIRTEWISQRRMEVYSDVADLPEAQSSPVIDFGAIDFSPVSGNQDEEFIELMNPGVTAVDLSGWQVSGGVAFTIPPGTVLPAGDSLYLSPDSLAFRTRAVEPHGGQRNFVVGPYSGGLSSFGETIELNDGAGVQVATTTFTGTPSDAQRFLVISEIYYNPPGSDDSEYLEILNISESVTVDLTDVAFVSGEDFSFTGSAITSLAPGQRALVVRDMTAFEAAFGSGLPVAGEFMEGSNLSNGSESIKLEDAAESTIHSFTYLDEAPWPLAADGGGLALILSQPTSRPDHELASSWHADLPTPGVASSAGFAGNPESDADGDGFPALLEYAMGTSDAAYTLQHSLTPAGLFTFQEDLAAFDVDLQVEFSMDLVIWLQIDEEALTRQSNGLGTEQVTYQFPPEGSKGFIRLRAVAQ